MRFNRANETDGRELENNRTYGKLLIQKWTKLWTNQRPKTLQFKKSNYKMDKQNEYRDLNTLQVASKYKSIVSQSQCELTPVRMVTIIKNVNEDIGSLQR